MQPDVPGEDHVKELSQVDPLRHAGGRGATAVQWHAEPSQQGRHAQPAVDGRLGELVQRRNAFVVPEMGVFGDLEAVGGIQGVAAMRPAVSDAVQLLPEQLPEAGVALGGTDQVSGHVGDRPWRAFGGAPPVGLVQGLEQGDQRAVGIQAHRAGIGGALDPDDLVDGVRGHGTPVVGTGDDQRRSRRAECQ